MLSRFFNNSNKEDIQKFKEKLKQNYKYELRLYQTFPVYYLKELYPNQKGLLINHLMGTGKTFTGLHFINEFKDKIPLIVCPYYLITNWQNEAVKLGIDKPIKYLNYDDFLDFLEMTNNLDDYILIIDEGHNLIYKIRNEMKQDEITSFYSKSKQFYKILFLSGTPFYNDEFDIVYIINLVSGEKIFSFNREIFEDEYFDKSVIKSALFGWINPILDSKISLGAFLIGFFVMYIWGMVESILLAKNEAQLDGLVNELENKSQPIDTNSAVVEFRDEVNKYKNHPMYKFIKEYLGIMKMDSALSYKTFDVTYIGAGIAVYLVFIFVLYTLVSIGTRFDLNKIKTLNVKRLGNKIKNYISFYEIKNEDSIIENLRIKHCHSELKDDTVLMRLFCNSYFERLDKSDYPSKEFIVRKTIYNQKQMEYYIKATYNRLDDNEYKQMGLIGMDESFYKKWSNEDFLNYGRTISNITFESGNDTIIPTKFKEIIKTSLNRQTVIYSNFYEGGIIKFKKYLESLNKTFRIIHPRLHNDEQHKIISDFKNKEYQYLLLHPDYTEGISIFGAEQLHILEPIESYAKLDQLLFRVVRFNSHKHLMARERKVKIYLWVTEVMPVASLIYNKLKGWKKYSSQVVYWKRFAKFEDSMSPESIVYNNNIKVSKLFSEFKNSIKNYSIESCSIKNKNFNCNAPISLRELMK